MIFFTWLGFLFYSQYRTDILANKKLNNVYKKIKNLNENKVNHIIEILDNLYISNILGDVMSNKQFNTQKIVKNNIWANFLDLRKKNWEIIFQNFDINKCNAEYKCKTINKWNYMFTIAIRNNNNLLNRYNILLFGIFSFFISILFFPLIYAIVSRLTKPIEINFEFMKNFVNNAWHELKTPIANINLSAQILQQQKEYNNEIVNDIINESNKLSKMIDTLLQLSILSKFENKENINLKQEIENILNEYKQQLKDIKLELELDEIYKTINKNQFDILFRNLLINAIKYNNEGKLIKIYLDKNKLIITNTWKEIPKQARKKIFNLFYRLENQKEWYWLWLALVKKIVDINKWKIKVVSNNWENAFIISF
jgi:signal transduction histidine kinase